MKINETNDLTYHKYQTPNKAHLRPQIFRPQISTSASPFQKLRSPPGTDTNHVTIYSL